MKIKLKDAAVDEKWMRLALELAERGRGAVSPNPMVGACLVRGGRVVGQGYHRMYGGPHAEIEAIRAAGTKARGSTLYVTLEPCSSWGKTAPCTEAILAAGICEVVVACEDPNPKHRGGGLAILKSAGVRVRKGVMENEARKLNTAFFKWVQSGLPYVTLKMAQSLDGKIATRAGLSRWISSPASRTFVHALRAAQDAILVGKGTWQADNPALTVRHGRQAKRPEKPWRVILDPQVELSGREKILKGPQLVFAAIDRKNIRKTSAKHFRRGIIWLDVPAVKGRLDLKAVLKKLGSLGVTSLLCEGGAETAWSLIEARLADHLVLIQAPKIIGGREAKTSVEGSGVSRPDQAFKLRNLTARKLGDDLILEGDF